MNCKFRMTAGLLAAALAGPSVCQSQTLVDLRTQSKSVDFSAANTTRPFKTGTPLPATCGVGEMFYKSDAPAGANLYGCTSLNNWTLQSSSGGGGGATLSTQLGDLATTFTNATTLTIGANCATSLPCNVRFGNTAYSFTAGATVTLSSGTGTAFVYIARGGVLTVGHNLTLTCSSACLAQSGVNQFPADSIPLATRTATNGAWDPTGGIDRRAFQSAKVIMAGAGLIAADTSGTTAVSVDANLVGLRVAVPANSASVCTAGTWSMDTSFYYVCVAANTWRRAGISSF